MVKDGIASHLGLPEVKDCRVPTPKVAEYLEWLAIRVKLNLIGDAPVLLSDPNGPSQDRAQVRSLKAAHVLLLELAAPPWSEKRRVRNNKQRDENQAEKAREEKQGCE